MIRSMSRYWPMDFGPLEQLPVVSLPSPPKYFRPTLRLVPSRRGPRGGVAPPAGLLVPCHLIGEGHGEPWERTDWWQAAFWYLNCSAERSFEETNGPIHSYSLRLKGWNPAMWRGACLGQPHCLVPEAMGGTP